MNARALAKIGLLTVAIGVLVASATAAAPAPLVGAPGELQGITGPFHLRATEGRIYTPEGNSIYMWGFAEDGGSFQYPGPTLIVNQGETVTINLTNQLPESVSIVFPGQTNVMAGVALAQPELDAGNLVSLTTSVAPGGTLIYSFVAEKPGTYIYESGTDPAKQVQMGLFGALIVRPSQANWAYNDPDTQFDPGREYLLLLHEIDPVIHEAVEDGLDPDLMAFWPRYWTINGRSFPDTLAPNDVPWLPGQPYGSAVVVEPYDLNINPLPALIRFANAGVHNHPFHTHGNHIRVIAHDGRLLSGPGGEDLSREEFTVTVGAGQTYDGLFTWTDVEGWDPVNNPIPVQLPDIRNLSFPGTMYSGSPYLGEQGDLPAWTVSMNECGEFYFPWHTHSEREMVNWGGEMGGMLTLLRVDPPSPNGCQ